MGSSLDTCRSARRWLRKGTRPQVCSMETRGWKAPILGTYDLSSGRRLDA
jgi:hypothetical protein